MKILVLAKRYTSGKDSVKDNFGRVIRLFEEVAKKHDVTIIEADHLKKEKFEARIGKMKVEVVPFSPIKLWSYYKYVKAEAKKGYDMIYATSYPLFGGLGLALAKINGYKFGYDVQDNYYAYTNNPALLFMSDQAIKRADLVSCASNILAAQAKTANRNVVMIPNGYNPKIAKRMDKKTARKRLGLPKGKIVAYTGSLEFRGPQMLMEAAGKVDAQLLFVGSGIKKKYGKMKKAIFLESMPYEKLFVAINAADVMVMPYPKNRFTEVMYAPYKLVEYMACGKPIVLSDAGEMGKLAPKFVFSTGDLEGMIRKINEALKHERISYPKIKEFTWQAIGRKLSKSISNIAL